MLANLQSHQKAILEQRQQVLAKPLQPIVSEEIKQEEKQDDQTPIIIEQLRQSQQNELNRLEKLLEQEKHQRIEQEAKGIKEREELQAMLQKEQARIIQEAIQQAKAQED